jgi:ferrochelatase
MRIGYLIVNFGGPRDLEEVRPFLEALLTDKEVISTRLPQSIHNFVFRRVARKRADKVAKDYLSIGGKSPIYADTEAVVEQLRKRLSGPILTFHRYLTDTHSAFKADVMRLEKECDELRIFPMFPQYTYATTGSIARWFQEHFDRSIINKMRWVKSYGGHPAFIHAQQQSIAAFLAEQKLRRQETVLLFSAHGIPQQFVDRGDPYQSECETSFRKIMSAFPEIEGKLCYQSKFGRGEWIKPYTIDLCERVGEWIGERRDVLFIPLSFTSDHIETLFEVETEYMTVIRQKGHRAWRLPALTLDPQWLEAIVTILQEDQLSTNRMLMRR